MAKSKRKRKRKKKTEEPDEQLEGLEGLDDDLEDVEEEEPDEVDEEDDDDEEDEEEDEEPKQKRKRSKSKSKGKKKRSAPPTRELPKGKYGAGEIAEIAGTDARAVRLFLRKKENKKKYPKDKDLGRYAFTKKDATAIAKAIKKAAKD